MLVNQNHFSRSELEELLSGMRDCRVLVYGDVMVDCFLRGVVERISPEAPVPVVAIRRRERRPGGAANVVRNLLALGGRPELVALVGADAAGEWLRQELRRCGCGVAGLVVDERRPTALKTRIIAHQQQVVRFDEESLEPLSVPVRERLGAAVRAACAGVDGVIISDYGKGVVQKELFDLLVDESRRRGLFLALDPKVANFGFYHDIDLVTPNALEAGQACGFTVTAETLVEAGRVIRRRFRSRALVITRGEDGMAIFADGYEPVLLPTLAREVFDVTGAGDTVIAALTLALVGGGCDLVQAARFANLAAGIVVGKAGTATVSGTEILAGSAFGRQPVPAEGSGGGE